MVLVFDGCWFSMKKSTEAKRKTSRKKHQEEGYKLLKQGDKEEAFKKLIASVNITPEMAYAVKTKILNIFGKRKEAEILCSQGLYF